jgi:hypothetical protein
VETLFVCYALDCDAGVGGRLPPGERPARLVHDVMTVSLATTTTTARPRGDSGGSGGGVAL